MAQVTGSSTEFDDGVSIPRRVRIAFTAGPCRDRPWRSSPWLGHLNDARRFLADEREDAALGVVEFGTRNVAWPRQIESDGFANPARPTRHDDDLVAQHQGLVDAMRDEHDGAAMLLPDGNKLFLHFELCLRIERREWLIHQDDARVHQQRPRNAYALVHSARQFGGVMMFEAPQADQIDEFHGPPLAFLLRDAFELEGECNIIDRSQPGHQCRLLKYHAAVRARSINDLAVD